MNIEEKTVGKCWALFPSVLTCKYTIKGFHSFPQTIYNTKKSLYMAR